jgi:hypothetical protein
MKSTILSITLAVLIVSACHKSGLVVTTGSLLNEMTDLGRLPQYTGQTYRTIQYSSYDRRSTKPGERSWFANDDGFGNEPIPGFEQVLKRPDTNGIGEYLICNIEQPGAIVRLWTAGIEGQIRFYLDDMSTPFYEGLASDFFWKTMEVLSAGEMRMDSLQALRQFDAVYFPIPFAEGCRIEWIGNLQNIHFYHVGVRIYNQDVTVETFKATDFVRYAPEINQTNQELLNEQNKKAKRKPKSQSVEMKVPASSSIEIFSARRNQAIERISLTIQAENYEEALRKCIIRIYFDGADTPQVASPVGDFFGTAPGHNPYRSLPFGVQTDSTMICRFPMPFKHSARIVLDNHSGEMFGVTGKIRTIDYKWEEGISMHFYCRWRINHDLTASNISDSSSEIRDIPYLNASGRGRIVGAAAFLYNPSNVPTSWGNWWGEGDEKIFIDKDSFPSFFGTGSEDYFNYSWSSPRIFSYAYCGQPRNDGPGNRGNVTNFRWHIIDDIPFYEKASFTMELGHHGTVPGFTYGRIVYFYALPGLTTDHPEISMEDIGEIAYRTWRPEAYKGSAGFSFIQAENIMNQQPNMNVEPGKMWADGSILMWKPQSNGEKNSFQIRFKHTIESTRIGFTLAHGPRGGKISIMVNGKPIKVDNHQTVDLFEPNQWILANHFSEPVRMNKGQNEITFIYIGAEKGKNIGIDFFWINDKANILNNTTSI